MAAIEVLLKRGYIQRQGKTLEDARAGGCSGCVEVGAFGKEAYILTGYFNMPKVFELALHDGLTRLLNRRGLEEAGRILARCDMRIVITEVIRKPSHPDIKAAVEYMVGAVK